MKTRSIIAICVAGAFACYSMKAMDKGAGFAALAKNHVGIFFSCNPIFEIAMEEGEEIFEGNLLEFRCAFANRAELNSLQENSAFIEVMGVELERRKTVYRDRLKDPLFEAAEVRDRLARIGQIERVFADFVAGYHLQKSGNWDAPLPIFSGLESMMKKDSIARVPNSSYKERLFSQVGIVLVGGFMIGMFLLSK